MFSSVISIVLMSSETFTEAALALVAAALEARGESPLRVEAAVVRRIHIIPAPTVAPSSSMT